MESWKNSNLKYGQRKPKTDRMGMKNDLTQNAQQFITFPIKIDVYLNCAYPATAYDDPDMNYLFRRKDGTVDGSAICSIICMY